MSYRLDVLKALGDKTRLACVLFLSKGEQSVLSIVSHVKKAQPTVSLALQKLEQAGLVSSRKEAKNVFYSIKEKELVEKLLRLISE